MTLSLRSPLIVAGVAGCGKTSVAEGLCARWKAPLIEGDALHPAANVAKMRAGEPLDDADRDGWLERLGDAIATAVAIADAAGTAAPIATCSALKRKYRERLRTRVPGLCFVLLDVPYEVALRRVSRRQGHYMPASLVASQFADFERPDEEVGVHVIDATPDLPQVLAAVLRLAP